MRKLSSWYVCIPVAVGLFLLDFITKKLVIHFLPSPQELFMGDGSDIVIFKNFFGIELSITHAINTGAAWGYFGQFPYLLLAFRIILISLLTGYLLFFRTPLQFRFPLMLILTGAVGNVVDFFLYGHVIDMIHFVFWGYSYPVFNIADSCIFVGTAMILILTLLEKEKT